MVLSASQVLSLAFPSALCSWFSSCCFLWFPQILGIGHFSSVESSCPILAYFPIFTTSFTLKTWSPFALTYVFPYLRLSFLSTHPIVEYPLSDGQLFSLASQTDVWHFQDILASNAKVLWSVLCLIPLPFLLVIVCWSPPCCTMAFPLWFWSFSFWTNSLKQFLPLVSLLSSETICVWLLQHLID